MNLRKIIREEVDDFDWVKDESPSELVIDWLNKNVVKVIKNGRRDIIHKDKPAVSPLKILIETYPDILDRLSDINQNRFPLREIIIDWMNSPLSGQPIDYDEYLNTKKNSVNFNDVKNFMMSEFSGVRKDTDGTVWIESHIETDDFMGDPVWVENWPVLGPKSHTEKNRYYSKRGKDFIMGSLIRTFGVNLINEVMSWLNKITDEEITEWNNKPTYVIPLKKYS